MHPVPPGAPATPPCPPDGRDPPAARGGAAIVATTPALTAALVRAAARHAHLCPRQVLGARMALAGARRLGLALPRTDKRLLVFAETDGCFVDGLAAASGCRVGRRTLRVEDQGKVAATFVDVVTEVAWRVRPTDAARAAASTWAPDAPDRWSAYVLGYQRMPEAALLDLLRVRLDRPAAWWVGRADARERCARCGEEVGNARMVTAEGGGRCRACAGEGYWSPAPTA